MSDEEWTVELNMDHPAVREMAEFMDTAPEWAVSAYFTRAARRFEFDSCIESIGGLTKYRRKLVVRALIKMFRAGYRAGRMAEHFDPHTEE